MKLGRRQESLPTRMLSAPREIGRRAVQHMPLVPDRYRQQPERRFAKGAIAAGAVALAAAGVMVARRMMHDRAAGEQQSTTVDWHQSEAGQAATHSHDGATPVMASPGEMKPDVTERP